MNPEPVGCIFVALVPLKRVEFERGYAAVDGLVVLPSRSVIGKTPYPDPRAVALVVKPLLKYGPSCRKLDVVVCGTVVLDTRGVVVCRIVVLDTRGVVVEFWYDTDTADDLLVEIVEPQATPKQ